MKSISLISAIAILLTAISPAGAQKQVPSRSLTTVIIPYESKAELKQYEGLFDREDVREDSVILHLPAEQTEALSREIPTMKMLPAEPALDDSDMASSLAEALSHDKYPTYEQYDSMMHYFAATYPEICMIETIGESIQGRLLLAVKISDNVEMHEDEPAFLYTATIHGDELVGYNLSLRFIDFLLQNYPSDPEVERLVNEVEIWINPLSNPDATYYPDNNSSVADSRRYNVNGYDLNRNYPDPRTGEENDTAGVEKENQEMMGFLNRHLFNLSANLHSGAEVVNYPWDHTYSLHPDNDWFIHISREYADEARVYNDAYMNEFTNGITNGADWYVIYGGRQDYVTYYLHGREVTLELSNTKKIQSENLETYWTYNQRSLLNYASQARYGIHGKVTSRLSGVPVAAEIRIPEHDDSSSWVRSNPEFGSFYRYLKEGVYNLVVEAENYVTDTIRGVEVTDFEKTVLHIQLDSTNMPDTTGANASPALSAMRIYPNPASDRIYLEIPDAYANELSYRLQSCTGQVLSEVPVHLEGRRATIPVGGLSPGIYFLTLETPISRQVERIIIQR